MYLRFYYCIFIASFSSLFFYFSGINRYFDLIRIISFSFLGIYFIKNNKIYFFVFLYFIFYNFLFYNFYIFKEDFKINNIYIMKGNIKDNTFFVKKTNKKYLQKKILIDIKNNDLNNGNYILGIKIIENSDKMYGEIVKKDRSTYEKYINFIEKRIEKYTKDYSEDFYNFYISLITGNKNFQNREDLKKYAYCGISHLMVISGMHFGIIFLILKKILEFLSISYKKRYIILIIVMTLYLLMCRIDIPVMRAYIMVIIFIFSKLLYEKYDIKKAFLICYLIHIQINPLNLYQASFQLSYTAVFSLIYILPLIKINYDSKIKEMFVTSFVIQIMMLPLSIYYFSMIPFLSVIANLFLSIYFVFLMTVFFINFIIGLIWIKGAYIFAGVSYFLYEIFKVYVDFFEKIPFMSIKLD